MELNAILAGGKMFGSGGAQKAKRPKYVSGDLPFSHLGAAQNFDAVHRILH